MNNKLQFWLASITSALLGLCALVADMPSALENQIPQFFPESQRGYITLACGLAAYVAHHYASSAARNALVAPTAPAMSPLSPTPPTSKL